MAKRLQAPDADDLEHMLDRYTLADLLDGLATICAEKAEHVRSNWQDETTAKLWERASMSVSTFGATSKAVKAVSE